MSSNAPARPEQAEQASACNSQSTISADQIRVISELAQIGSDAYAMLDYQERGHV